MSSHALMAFLRNSDGLGMFITSKLLLNQAKASNLLFKIKPQK
jgi:hypothetical protein